MQDMMMLGHERTEALIRAVEQGADVVEMNHVRPSKEDFDRFCKALRRNESVKVLCLTWNGLDAEFGKDLANALRQNRTLRVLDVSYNKLGNEGGQYLANALRGNTSLKFLEISWNGLGPDGIECVETLLKENDTLRTLGISWNGLGQGAGQRLVEAVRFNENLEGLNANGNSFDEETAKAIEECVFRNLSAKNEEALNREMSQQAETLYEEITRMVFGLSRNRKTRNRLLETPEYDALKTFKTLEAEQIGCVREWRAMKAEFDQLLGDYKKIQDEIRETGVGPIEKRRTICEAIVFTGAKILQYDSNRQRQSVAHWLSGRNVATTQGNIEDIHVMVFEYIESVENAVDEWRKKFDTSLLLKETRSALASLFSLDELLDNRSLAWTQLERLREIHDACSAEIRASNTTDETIMAEYPQGLIEQMEETVNRFHECLAYEFSEMEGYFQQVREQVEVFNVNMEPPSFEVVEGLTKELKTLSREEKILRRDLLDAELELDDSPNDPEKQQKVEEIKTRLSNLTEDLPRRKRKISLALMHEQVRLLRIADRYFPELLRDPEWLNRVNLDPSVTADGDMLSLMKSGKLMHGTKISGFQEKQSLGHDRPDRKVLLVEDEDGREKVLKVFNLQQSVTLMKQFYRQCSLLDSLPSAYFCHIDGFFVDGEKGCLLMAFYPNGDLAKWLSDPTHVNEFDLKKRILADVLMGLIVLHERNLVHCDIKPQNIFLTRNNCAIIGDFDGVRQGNMTMTRVQATDKYLCPEFQSAREPHPSMDMWAVGVMMEEMFPGDHGAMELIHYLKLREPEQRWSAQQALNHPFVHSNRAIEMVHCSLGCLENVKKSESISCGSNHHCCRACINGLVANWSRDSNDTDEIVSCKIPCWHHPRECSVDSLQSFMHLLDQDTLDAYLNAIKRRTEKFHTKPLKEKIEEMERNQAASNVSRHVKEILDMIAIKCPRNGHPFTEFDGCFALKCALCSCNFCGWCLKDCGNDAHPHVPRCLKNRSRQNNNDDIWGLMSSEERKKKMFRDTHNPQRERALIAYWSANVPKELRPQVFDEIYPYINIYQLNVDLPK